MRAAGQLLLRVGRAVSKQQRAESSANVQLSRCISSSAGTALLYRDFIQQSLYHPVSCSSATTHACGCIINCRASLLRLEAGVVQRVQMVLARQQQLRMAVLLVTVLWLLPPMLDLVVPSATVAVAAHCATNQQQRLQLQFF
jgi:hypothetical protein